MTSLIDKRGKKLKLFRKRKGFSVLFIFIFLILFVLLLINFSDIFSSLITNKGSLFYTQKIEVPSYTVYAVSLKDFDNLEDAENYSYKVKQNGGAGYVYESGEKFVFVSSYPSLMEAKEIKQNLTTLGYEPRIVNLKIDALSKNYKGSNSKDIIFAINFFRNCFLEVQNAVINFDKNLSNQNQVNAVLAKLLTRNVEIINAINNLSEQTDLPIKSVISVPLEETKTMLEKLLYFVGDDMEYTSNLKDTCIKIVLKNKQLVNKLNAQ